MASSKEWANFISSIASFMYFLLIIFQIPLFRYLLHFTSPLFLLQVPCRFGMCKTPIEVTTSQLMASELFPTYVVKVLLYPGAVANAIIKRRTLPRYSKLLKLYNISALRKSTAVSDLQRLEVNIYSQKDSYPSVIRLKLFGDSMISEISQLLFADSCRKLLVCGGSFYRSLKACKNEPVWDNAYNMESCQRYRSGTIS
ncbi:hypothetical protein Gotur_020197 [Gossypium turneri]